MVVLPDGRILAGGGQGGARSFLLARFLPNGTPDPAFGEGGISLLPSAYGTRGISALARQDDGMILAAGLGSLGGTDAFAVARYTADGSDLDLGFNGGEPVLFRFANVSSDAFDVDAAPGGKVVVVGVQKPGDNNLAALRLTSNGEPDGTFNNTGDTVGSVPGSTSTSALAVDVLPDGSMIIAGSTTNGLFLTKLTELGALDTDFGTNGYAVHDAGTDPGEPSGDPFDIRVLSDGRILMTGDAVTAADDDQLFLARFTDDGDLDPTFADGGLFRRDPTPVDDAGHALALQPDGKIVVAGMRAEEDNVADTWMLRFTPSGQLDPSFGAAGETVVSAVPAYDAPYGVALDAAGNAVVAGTAFDGGTDKLLVGRFLGDPVPVGPGDVDLLDPDLRELELVGRRLTPFGVSCASACSAEVSLRSRKRVTLPKASAARKAVVTIARTSLAGVTGRRTVRLRASKVARRILKRRKIAAALRVAVDGGDTVTRNVVVRAAQRKLVVSRSGRGRLRVTFRAEAATTPRATLSLRLGGRTVGHEARRAEARPLAQRQAEPERGRVGAALARLPRAGEGQARLPRRHREARPRVAPAAGRSPALALSSRAAGRSPSAGPRRCPRRWSGSWRRDRSGRRGTPRCSRSRRGSARPPRSPAPPGGPT